MAPSFLLQGVVSETVILSSGDAVLPCCPIDGVVMFGPADKAQVEDGYQAATTDIPEDIWEAFELEFGIKRGV